MKQSLIKYGILSSLLILVIVGCNPWEKDIQLTEGSRDKDVYELISARSDLSIFKQVLDKTDYDKFLQEERSLTVFAPSNEALSDLDLSDTEALKQWIQNYIARLAFYVDESNRFDINAIRMINKKNVPVTNSQISGTNLVSPNLTASNGVVHIIDGEITARMSVLEYLLSMPNYEQVEFIKSENDLVMDMERSIQIGVDATGRPLYDTIWVTKNEFLDSFPLGDEEEQFTYLLLEPAALSYLKTKYAPYLIQETPEQQDKTVMNHIVNDMLLQAVTIGQDGRYTSLSQLSDSLLVDVKAADIVETYQASNGLVYKINAVDVKIYENKIRTQWIEAEDYTDRWDGQDGWEVRYRQYASGGMDVTLKGQTRNTFTYDIWDESGDSMLTKTETKTFNMVHRSNEGFVSKSNNAYLKYSPTMYSVPYQIYWRSYDDKSGHIYKVNDTIILPMVFEQKMLISFPGKPALMREADGTIVNNFSSYSMMVGISTAGVLEETKLKRYRAVENNNMYMLATSISGALQPWEEEDVYGKDDIIYCPNYGQSTLFVSNTVREKDTNAGVLFLDYIRLVPIIDPNE